MAYTGSSFLLPDNPANPLRIKPPEGEMIAIKRGSKDGPLDRIVASVSGWHFKHEEPGFIPADEWEKWELLPDVVEGNRVYTPPTKSMPETEFGIIVVGFLRALHIPHMRYVKWELKPEGTDSGLVRKDRKDSPFFFFQYTMGIPVLEVESVGNFKTTIRMNVVVRLVNPYKAQFLAGGWEGLLDAAVHGAVRDYIAELSVKRIREERESGGLADRVKDLNENTDGFKSKFGVQIIDVRFVGFDIVGSERVQNALEAEEVNRLMAGAASERAKEIMTLGKAQADAAALSVTAYGGGMAAAAVRAAELVAEALKKR
ncbi:MAG: SPFH domain-containing protein [Parcubacteria group bacterium]